LAEEVSESDIYILLILQLEQLMKNIMAKYEIEEFDPTDQPYDPNCQESLSKVPTPEGARAGYVARTMQTGYRMRGRLLRSARVVIFS
jgi:molecular chaperone GrpE